MTALFPKNRDRGRAATFTWPDGSAATTPIWGRPEQLPHDLTHYAVEAAFRPPYGFWSLTAQQAPFESLTLIRGRWPARKYEWFRRVRRKHGLEMLKAESVGIESLLRDGVDLDAVIPRLRRQLERTYTFSANNAFANASREQFVAARDMHLKLAKAWAGTPMGGGLEVNFPPTERPRVLQRVDQTA